MQWIIFIFSTGQTVNHVHNFVQVNILIRIHCPKSLGFDFKNHGGQFRVVSPQRSQMKTASILQSA